MHDFNAKKLKHEQATRNYRTPENKLTKREKIIVFVGCLFFITLYSKGA